MTELSKTEQEFRSKLSMLLWNPPKSTYASSSGGTYEDTDYFKFEAGILALFEEAGYRLPTGKAPLLTDEEIRKIRNSLAYLETRGDNYLIRGLLLKAQNDADNKHFGGKE